MRMRVRAHKRRMSMIVIYLTCYLFRKLSCSLLLLPRLLPWFFNFNSIFLWASCTSKAVKQSSCLCSLHKLAIFQIFLKISSWLSIRDVLFYGRRQERGRRGRRQTRWRAASEPWQQNPHTRQRQTGETRNDMSMSRLTIGADDRRQKKRRRNHENYNHWNPGNWHCY